MSGVIKILPQYVANRIAAGEVVGRPESVVKELIENSIDAVATKIVVRIKDAGKTLIQVSDNGTGMSSDDALLSVQRHATSKIAEADDLENIKTLGFRGEALASICAVSQIEIVTRTNNDELATSLLVHGNEIVEHSQTNSDKGTSVTVKNLFYNTPARRNFLKSDQTEFKHIYDTFTRLAISNPEICFCLINNDEVIYDLEENNLFERLTGIYSSAVTDEFIPLKSNSNNISVEGYISKPKFSKRTKQDQFLYLNNRFVLNKQLSYAVHLAYGDLIEKGDYPYFFLFLKLDPRKFDINVHPSKLEVKFDDERLLFNFIKNAIKQSLNEHNLILDVSFQESEIPSNYTKSDFYSKSSSGNRNQNFNQSFNFEKGRKQNIHEIFQAISRPAAEDERTDSEKDNDRNLTDIRYTPTKQSIWQFQKKYILYQLENVLMIIDQHAAHERILYELALDRLNSNANLSQQLLIPVYIELSVVDYEIASSLESELKALGFDIEFMQNRKIRLKGVPSDVRIGDEDKIIQDMIDKYKEYDVKLNLEKRDNIAKVYACKHAIKSGDLLADQEMLNLIDNLFLTKVPYVCPHGRPTIIKIPVEELDSKFARTGY